jgi:hypothetical protein
MVTVVDYLQRKNSKGEEFFLLVLQGEMEVITSSQSGKSYATAHKANLATTFNEPMCVSMVGKELPGSIQKVSCEPYEYQIPGSDEVIELDFRWEYNPVEVQTPKGVPAFSSNGVRVH